MSIKAFSYLRVSGKGQIGGDGFPRQRDIIGKYAKAKRIEVVREYLEKGVCGENEVADRPALTDLLSDIASNGVRIILVEQAQRLARDTIVQELIIKEVQKLGVRIIAADSGINLTEGDKNNPTQKLIRQILGAVSEWEKCTLVIKLRLARERIRRKTGRCEGPKPFGQLPGEAPTVDRIKELRAQKLSLQKLANALNAEPDKYRSRSGRPWSKMTIKNVVDRCSG